MFIQKRRETDFKTLWQPTLSPDVTIGVGKPVPISELDENRLTNIKKCTMKQFLFIGVFYVVAFSVKKLAFNPVSVLFSNTSQDV